MNENHRKLWNGSTACTCYFIVRLVQMTEGIFSLQLGRGESLRDGPFSKLIQKYCWSSVKATALSVKRNITFPFSISKMEVKISVSACFVMAQLVVSLPHSYGNPGSILSLYAACAEFAPSPCDHVVSNGRFSFLLLPKCGSVGQHATVKCVDNRQNLELGCEGQEQLWRVQWD